MKNRDIIKDKTIIIQANISQIKDKEKLINIINGNISKLNESIK